MPKAKVTKKKDGARPSGSVSRTPVKVRSNPTPIWWMTIMFGLMIVGLGWLVAMYIAPSSFTFFTDLGAWNYAIGFGMMITGLLMTMRWR